MSDNTGIIITLIRVRRSDQDMWSDNFIYSGDQDPKKALRDAVLGYLSTPDGEQAYEQSCEDFNWGDAIMEIPSEYWMQHDIKPVNTVFLPEAGVSYSFASVLVDQDEHFI